MEPSLEFLAQLASLTNIKTFLSSLTNLLIFENTDLCSLHWQKVASLLRCAKHFKLLAGTTSATTWIMFLITSRFLKRYKDTKKSEVCLDFLQLN